MLVNPHGHLGADYTSLQLRLTRIWDPRVLVCTSTVAVLDV